LITLDTVIMDVPAFFATSRKVALFTNDPPLLVNVNS